MKIVLASYNVLKSRKFEKINKIIVNHRNAIHNIFCRQQAFMLRKVQVKLCYAV